MISHVILFSPKGDLSHAGRVALVDALVTVSTTIPSIRSFRVGRRVKHGLAGYEQQMAEDYQFAAIIEFDDLDGLTAYLAHPSHATLGAYFGASGSRALAYDYTLVDAGDARQLIE